MYNFYRMYSIWKLSANMSEVYHVQLDSDGAVVIQVFIWASNLDTLNFQSAY